MYSISHYILRVKRNNTLNPVDTKWNILHHLFLFNLWGSTIRNIWINHGVVLWFCKKREKNALMSQRTHLQKSHLAWSHSRKRKLHVEDCQWQDYHNHQCLLCLPWVVRQSGNTYKHAPYRWSDIIMLRRHFLLRWYLWQQRVGVMIGLLVRGRIRIKIRIRNRPGVTFNVSFYHWSNNCRGSECRTFPACTRYLAKRSHEYCFPPPLRW